MERRVQPHQNKLRGQGKSSAGKDLAAGTSPRNVPTQMRLRGSRGGKRRKTQVSRKQRVYVERMSFSLLVGRSQDITFGNLRNKPTSCNLRPLSISARCAAFVPTTASDARAGFYAPCAFQIDMFNPAGEIVASGAPRVIPPQNTTVKCHYPKSADWWPYNNTSSDSIARITAVCLGGNSELGLNKTPEYVQGIISIPIAFGPEIMDATCPSLPVLDTPQYESNHLQRLERKEDSSQSLDQSFTELTIQN